MRSELKTIFAKVFAGAAALALLGAASAALGEGIYTVGNYPVDAEAKNAVDAKKKALAEGQQAAFRSLLKRVVPVTAYDRLKRLSSINSSSFFEGVSVRSERNSPTRYIASLDFSFRPDSVRYVLQREGIPFVEEQAPELIVVPVVRDAQGAFETGRASRVWTGIWKDLDLEHTLTPIDLQRLKPQIQPDSLKMLVEGQGGAERILAGEYKSPRVIVAIADLEPSTQRVIVTLVGMDAVGPINLKRRYRVFDGDTSYTMELAAVVGLGVLEGRWKAVKSGSGGGFSGQLVALQARYTSLAEWNEMRRQLLEMAGVEGLRIDAQSARSADLSLRYPGGAEGLASALYSRGLALKRAGGGLILQSRY
jgi:hypothetical protein